MKKKLAILFGVIAVVATICITTHIRSAPGQSGGGTSSRYNSMDFITTDLRIDDGGEATLTIHAKGISDHTTFYIASHVEQEAENGQWVRVENGQEECTWTDVISGLNCSVTHTAGTGRKARCRAVVYFRITGEGEVYSDTITVYTTRE